MIHTPQSDTIYFFKKKLDMAWHVVFSAKELLGRNLYELITEQQGLLPVRLVYEATRQVLSALEYLNLAWVPGSTYRWGKISSEWSYGVPISWGYSFSFPFIRP